MEDASSAQLEKATYSGHIIAENERMTAETQREVVKKLLAKLQRERSNGGYALLPRGNDV